MPIYQWTAESFGQCMLDFVLAGPAESARQYIEQRVTPDFTRSWNGKVLQTSREGFIEHIANLRRTKKILTIKVLSFAQQGAQLAAETEVYMLTDTIDANNLCALFCETTDDGKLKWMHELTAPKPKTAES